MALYKQRVAHNERIRQAYVELDKEGLPRTHRAVADKAGVSVRSIYRYRAGVSLSAGEKLLPAPEQVDKEAYVSLSGDVIGPSREDYLYVGYDRDRVTSSIIDRVAQVICVWEKNKRGSGFNKMMRIKRLEETGFFYNNLPIPEP